MALFAMHAHHLPDLFPPGVMRRLQQLVDIDPALVTDRFDSPESLSALFSAEILITSWGCPPLDAAVLKAAPRLRAVLHAAGTVKAHVTPQCWERGLLVSSAADANAVPVAEYTLAAILLAGKDAFRQRDGYRASREFTVAAVLPDVGNYGRKIGIIGASRTGRRVIGLLRHFDVEIYLSDPYADQATAQQLGARLLGLEELLALCDIVSVHAPETLETRHLLSRERLALMRDGTTLINTARGALVDTEALTDELFRGRLNAVLDVTEPEPLPSFSPLFDLPNVFLTPHVAGSHGNELERLGVCVVDEAERLVTGLPLVHQITLADLERVA
jgi:phosphoglycerate dehydrogenase-like enzyme